MQVAVILEGVVADGHPLGASLAQGRKTHVERIVLTVGHNLVGRRRAEVDTVRLMTVFLVVLFV